MEKEIKDLIFEKFWKDYYETFSEDEVNKVFKFYLNYATGLIRDIIGDLNESLISKTKEDLAKNMERFYPYTKMRLQETDIYPLSDNIYSLLEEGELEAYYNLVNDNLNSLYRYIAYNYIMKYSKDNNININLEVLKNAIIALSDKYEEEIIDVEYNEDIIKHILVNNRYKESE